MQSWVETRRCVRQIHPLREERHKCCFLDVLYIHLACYCIPINTSYCFYYYLPFCFEAWTSFVTLRSLSLPVSSSYTSPYTHKFFLPPAHAFGTGSELATLFTCTLPLTSMSLVRISGCGEPPTSLWASSTSGVSKRWRTGPTCGGGDSVVASRAALAPPHFVWPTTRTVASASSQTRR